MSELFVVAIYLSFALDFIVFPIPSEVSTVAITKRNKKTLTSKTLIVITTHAVVLLTWLLPLVVAIYTALSPASPSVSWFFYVGVVLAVVGRIITISTSVVLYQRRSSSLNPILQTTGLFALSRHPIVLGLHITLAGLLMTVGTSWLLVPYLLTLIYFDYKLHQEEKLLRETFGKAYAHYMNQTRRYVNWPWNLPK